MVLCSKRDFIFFIETLGILKSLFTLEKSLNLFDEIINIKKKKPKLKLEKDDPNLTIHKISDNELRLKFNTSLENGLDTLYAKEILAKFGKNQINTSNQKFIFKIIGYFFSGFCALLWIASVICILAWKPIGNPSDPTNLGLGILLIVVILLQAAFNAFQDWSSSKVMKSIKNMIPSSAIVIREGKEQKINAEELVIGDLVLLSYGNKVPADVRIIESIDLKFDKSMLTGESEAVDGSTLCTDDNFVESKNIAFMTTLVTNGKGRGIVIATGNKTMIGKIASLTSSSAEKMTTLQKEIRRFVILIASIAVATNIVLVIIWATWLRVKYPNYIDVPTLMVNIIAVTVGFIPTGLPVAVTLSLLVMARKMARNRVLVKNLTTVETLSCVNVIASDKTGTLTQNKMFVADIFVGEEKFLNEVQIQKDNDSPAFKHLIALAYLCNNATFEENTHDFDNMSLPVEQKKANGDATDIALLKFSAHYSNNIRSNYTTLIDVPFNSRNKWMMKIILPNDLELHNNSFATNESSTVHLMCVKGAPDKILTKCSSILQPDGTKKVLDDTKKLNIINVQNEWCLKGQRVLLLAEKKLSNKESTAVCMKSSDEIEKFVEDSRDLCLIGMVGIIDPPREGIQDVITKCRGAGIRVLMVTGDYALTAAAISKEIGIFTNLEFDTIIKLKEKKKSLEANPEDGTRLKSLLLNGTDIDFLEDDDWRLVTTYDEIVFARTTPEQKLKIVKEFQKDKYVVAVTGDGVNDAPALKNADIGIAMGAGSEVAMEASKMILLDNSFHSILVAIENGRLVFDNLRKVILYLIPAGSFSELCPILVNMFLGVPLPLSAFLMICICILTDMLPALALMLEKPEKNLLHQAPRNKKDHLVDWKLLLQAYLFIGVMEAVFSHLIYFVYLYWYAGFHPSEVFLAFDKWKTGYKNYSQDQLSDFVYTGQTIVFISLVVMQAFGNVFSTRTNLKSLFQSLPFLKKSRNLWIFLAQFVTIIFMILIVFVPFCNSLFNTRQVPAQFFFIPLGFALIIFGADELRKLAVRYKILCFSKISW